MEKGKIFLLIGSLVLLIGLIACGASKAAAPISVENMNIAISEICQKALSSGQPPTRVEVLSSIYVGWMPAEYASEQGIFDRWGKLCNVEFNFRMATDYISSIEAYVAGQAHIVSMTNMEALNFAATAGVDTTAIANGDTSYGNDAVITREGLGLCDLKGRDVYLVELSVSHYLLARGLEEKCEGVTESDLNLINASDADIGSLFLANPSQEAVVTWNPIKLEILRHDLRARSVFDSSQIAGEIIDGWYGNTELLKDHPEVGIAFAGGWYEVMDIMTLHGPERDSAVKFMAEAAGDTLETYEEQLKTTNMFWTPEMGVSFTADPQLIQTMDLVRKFSFDHGLFGEGARSVDDVGIAFPNGSILGDANNVKLRYTTEYMSAVR